MSTLYAEQNDHLNEATIGNSVNYQFYSKVQKGDITLFLSKYKNVKSDSLK